MNKRARHAQILQLIQQHQISRQHDIVTALQASGFPKVTQATVSRDVNELQLVKVPKPGGGFYYGLSDRKQRPGEQKLRRVLQSSFVSAKVQRDKVLLKVQPGTGAVIGNLLDQMNWPEIFGTMVNYDAVMVFISEGNTGQAWMPQLQELLLKD